VQFSSCKSVEKINFDFSTSKKLKTIFLLGFRQNTSIDRNGFLEKTMSQEQLPNKSSSTNRKIKEFVEIFMIILIFFYQYCIIFMMANKK